MKIIKSIRKHSNTLLVAGVALLIAVSIWPKKPLNNSYRGSIVRLVDVSSGLTFCSGFVVSESRLITAAHCVDGMSPMDQIEIRGADNLKSDVRVNLACLNRRADLAIMYGHLQAFPSLSYTQDPQDVRMRLLFSRSKKVACGYPWGGALYCVPAYDFNVYMFGVKAYSFMFPGMSGGPLIDLEDITAVALNTAGYEDKNYFSPLSEIISACER